MLTEKIILLAQSADRYGLDTAKGQVPDLIDAPGEASAKIAELLGTITGSLLAWLGVLFLLLMIAGGIIWMTAAGNETKISRAKSLIVAAVIGLVIVLSAYAITSYLGDTLK